MLPNDRTTTDGAAGRPAGISKPQKGLLQRRGFFWSIVGAVVAVVIAVPLAFFFWGNGGTAAVPDGFPAQEQLPLADGERIASSDPDGDLMSVTIRVDDAEAQQAAVEQMQAAGFWVTGQSGSGPIGHVVSMSSDEFTARLSFSHSEEAGYQIKYMIAQR
ncbi:hypothetical protein [Leucobacter chromiiresistens]|uniref:Uncharacterized protein n=1 Tax=Leucobacter chromiiresistens TaxID=1079994 RepID=A0A147ENS8_9MICO|nr:hypothetical protein [Leucobacter chromiiresistens]KTR86117.1 hypothetical protein NS354_06380 [Leucobacter chromiiresistens]